MKRWILCAAVLAAGSGSVIAADDAVTVDPAKAALAANPDLEFAPNRVLVRFHAGASEADKTFARTLVGGQVRRTFAIVPRLELVDVPGDAMDAIAVLSAMPSVEYAEPDYVVRPTDIPNDPSFGQQYGLLNIGQTVQGSVGIVDADIDADEAWDTFTGSSSFVIAVIDTGVNWGHPDLDANIWSNPGEIAGNGIDDDGNGYVDDIRGWDFFDVDNNPADPNGHGTHVAGTIAAESDNGLGVAGVLWQAKIMPLRFIGPFGGFISDAVLAVDYAAAKGVRVSNNSWGGGGFSSPMINAINNAGASANHLFVCAAGNNGSNIDSAPFYPASYNSSNLLCVAATTNRDLRAGFSNFGAVGVDVGAPGQDVLSTYGSSGYAYLSGTSMASPHAAGVVAAVYIQNPTWTFAQVKQRVMDTVRPISALATNTVSGGVVSFVDALNDDVAGPPNQPDRPTVTNLGAGVANVQWDIVTPPSVDRWQVQRQRRVGGVWTNEGTIAMLTDGAARSYDDAGASTGRIRYRVRANNGDGWSSWSQWRAITMP